MNRRRTAAVAVRDSDWRGSSDRRSRFRSAAPPQLQTGRYASDYMETMDLGELNSALRPWDCADVARYFAGGGGPRVEPCCEPGDDAEGHVDQRR